MFINQKKCLWLYLLLIFMTIVLSCNSDKRNYTDNGVAEEKSVYTCSMHPQIIRDKPGECPICGMQLIRKVGDTKRSADLQELTMDSSAHVFAVTAFKQSSEEIEIEALGNIQNDTRQLATISAKVSGRIEKLYVRYRYQMVMPGDRIMDLYSPELATAQQNLLFILRKDDTNTSLLEAAKQRLLLMGMSNQQLQQLIRTKEASLTVSVYSNAMGHVHEAGQEKMDPPGPMQTPTTATQPLAIREGMYVQAGEKIFSLTNPQKAWAVLNLYPENQHSVKIGDEVKIIPEALPQKAFTEKIDFIETAYRQGNKTLTARVYFDNDELSLPIGSQIRASIRVGISDANWLPAEAVVSLGLNDIVFIHTNKGFEARKVKTGIRQKQMIQIISGLTSEDSVATNAQYLTDSDSFIKLKQ